MKVVEIKKGTDDRITARTVQAIFEQAKEKAGIKKEVSEGILGFHPELEYLQCAYPSKLGVYSQCGYKVVRRHLTTIKKS